MTPPVKPKAKPRGQGVQMCHLSLGPFRLEVLMPLKEGLQLVALLSKARTCKQELRNPLVGGYSYITGRRVGVEMLVVRDHDTVEERPDDADA